MISVRELTERHGATTAVDHLTFEAPPGQVTGFHPAAVAAASGFALLLPYMVLVLGVSGRMRVRRDV